MNHPHVLIVEDDDLLSRMYMKILVHANFKTRRVSNVRDAINALAEFDPDVVCLDWHLWDAHGSKFLDYLREQVPFECQPKIILMSAGVESGEIAPYLDLIAANVPKPVTVKELVAAVTRLSHEVVNRLPIQEIRHTLISDHTVLMQWLGYITPSLIRRTMLPELQESRTAILDIGRLNVTRLNMNEFPSHHPPLPNLKQVYVVCSPENHSTALYLVKYLQASIGAVEVVYMSELEQAVAQAIG